MECSLGAVLFIPPLILAGIHGIQQNPGIPVESNGIQEFLVIGFKERTKNLLYNN
jgi:hypothetical protein